MYKLRQCSTNSISLFTKYISQWKFPGVLSSLYSIPNPDRLSTPNFVNMISEIISNPSHKKDYYRLSIINVHEIIKSRLEIIHSPNQIQTINGTIENHYRSDIKIGFVKVKGQPFPYKFAYKVQQMVELARLYAYKNPESEIWDSGELM